MPYILPEERTQLAPLVRAMKKATPDMSGGLNYGITQLILAWLEKRAGYGYYELSVAIGALECAKLELYRRLLAPHEDEAKERNGDVY